MELTDRQLAIRWWKRRNHDEKKELAENARLKIENRNLETLTGSEIEWIWKHQQAIN